MRRLTSIEVQHIYTASWRFRDIANTFCTSVPQVVRIKLSLEFTDHTRLLGAPRLDDERELDGRIPYSAMRAGARHRPHPSQTGPERATRNGTTNIQPGPTA